MMNIDTVYTEHAGLVKGIAYKFTHNWTMAEDLSQDIWIKILANLERYDETKTSDFKLWLITVARRVAIDLWRQNKKRAMQSLDAMEGYDPPSGEDLGFNFLANQRMDLIFNKLDQLEPDLRDCLKLHADGFDYDEIASTLKINAGTAKSRVYRAKSKLRANLAK